MGFLISVSSERILSFFSLLVSTGPDRTRMGFVGVSGVLVQGCRLPSGVGVASCCLVVHFMEYPDTHESSSGSWGC